MPLCSFAASATVPLASRVPTSRMGVAVLAEKVCDVFLDPSRAALNDAGLGRAVVEAAREFDRASTG
jgi:hypothetical protein